MKKTFFRTIFVTIFILLLLSCAQREETGSLSIGLMPAVDSAPILLAEREGLFAEEGLETEITIYTNAQNRQSALQANRIDGAMTDLVALASNVNSGFEIKGVMMTEGLFPVLHSPDLPAPAESGRDKPRVRIGMMELSVSNFLADRRLADGYELHKVFINEIPLRLEAVASGQLDLGVFPEPLASLGEMRGLEKKIVREDYCPDIMVFTHPALEQKAEAISAFIKAYNRAAEMILENPDLAREVLIEKITSLPPEIQDRIALPEYPPARLQSDAYIRQVVQWTEETLGQDYSLTIDDLVNREFVE